MSQPEDVRRPLMWSMLGGGAAVLGLWFLPFVGFTERFTVADVATFRDVEAAGLGTYGQEFNWFSYPDYVGVMQLIVFGIALVILYGVVALWMFHRAGTLPTAPVLGRLTRRSVGAAALFVVVVLSTLLIVFPAVEDDTIWNTHARGFISDWWVGWGAGVALLGLGVTVWALRALRSHVTVASE